MAVKTAVVGDTVQYRNADGETYNVTVTGAQAAAPSNTLYTVTSAELGGTLAAGTYSYRVSYVKDGVETPASTTKAGSAIVGATGQVTLDATALLAAVPTATSWKVYGRVAASELLIATVTFPTVTYVDTGAVTPSGAVKAATSAVRLQNRSTREILSQIPLATGMKETGVYFKR